MKTTLSGEKVNWLHIKWILVRREKPRCFFINYSFQEAEFRELNVESSCITRNARKRKATSWMEEIPPLYQDKIPISQAKKKDEEVVDADME